MLCGQSAALLAASLGGCTGSPDPPEQPTASATAFAELEHFGRTMIDDGAPAVLMQVRNKGEEWSRAIGVRSLETREPVQPSDPVEVASVTKSMVAVTVLKLVEEGRLRLDDAVSEHLPDFGRVVHPPFPVTVRDLLSHSSGMPDYAAKLIASRPLKEVINTRLSLTERLAWAGGRRGRNGSPRGSSTRSRTTLRWRCWWRGSEGSRSVTSSVQRSPARWG